MVPYLFTARSMIGSAESTTLVVIRMIIAMIIAGGVIQT